MILIATILGGILIVQYLSVHNSPLLTFISGLEDLCMDRKWLKTVEKEPQITVDFNSALCHSLCQTVHAFTKSVQSDIMETCPCNEDPFTPQVYIVKLGFTGIIHVFLILL